MWNCAMCLVKKRAPVEENQNLYFDFQRNARPVYQFSCVDTGWLISPIKVKVKVDTGWMIYPTMQLSCKVFANLVMIIFKVFPDHQYLNWSLITSTQIDSRSSLFGFVPDAQYLGPICVTWHQNQWLPI